MNTGMCWIQCAVISDLLHQGDQVICYNEICSKLPWEGNALTRKMTEYDKIALILYRFSLPLFLSQKNWFTCCTQRTKEFAASTSIKSVSHGYYSFVNFSVSASSIFICARLYSFKWHNPLVQKTSQAALRDRVARLLALTACFSLPLSCQQCTASLCNLFLDCLWAKPAI